MDVACKLCFIMTQLSLDVGKVKSSLKKLFNNLRNTCITILMSMDYSTYGAKGVR